MLSGFFIEQRRPHSIAVAVKAKNVPPAHFLNASTVLKEIILYIRLFTALMQMGAVSFFIEQRRPHSVAVYKILTY